MSDTVKDRHSMSPSQRKAQKLNQKKAARVKRKREEKEAQLLADLYTGFENPPGVNITPLECTSLDGLRRCPTGYHSMKGTLKGLFIGTDMATAIMNNRTPYLMGKDHDDVINSVKNLLCDVDMITREREFLKKVGPFYLRPLKSWWDKVIGIYSHKESPLEALMPHLEYVRDEYVKMLPDGNKLSCLLPDECVHRMNTTSSTGYPFFTKDWFSEVELDGERVSPIEWGRRVANHIIETGDADEIEKAYYVLFTRKQYRGLIDSHDLKASERPVQCSSIIERFIGAGIQQPLMDLQSTHPYSQGLKGVEHMGHPIKRAFAEFDSALEADYSNFDATIHPDVISAVFDVVLRPIFEEKDHARLEILKRHYKTAKLWTPLGVVSSDSGPGLMSGSMLTNCIGMIVGMAVWHYVITRMQNVEGIALDHVAFGYSDDLAVHYNQSSVGDRDLGELFAKYANEVGLIAHKDKQKLWTGEDLQTSFLGHVFFPHRVTEDGACEHIYPIMRSLSKMIWYEHFGDTEYSQFTTQDDLLPKEKEACALLGRLDVCRNNGSYELYVQYMLDNYPIDPRDIARVDTGSYSYEEVKRRGREDSNRIDNSEFTPEELDELFTLIDSALQDSAGRIALRKWVKIQRTAEKKRSRGQRRQEYLDRYSPQSPQVDQKESQPCEEHRENRAAKQPDKENKQRTENLDHPEDLADLRERVLRQLAVCDSYSKRRLLDKLRKWAVGSVDEEVADDGILTDI